MAKNNEDFLAEKLGDMPDEAFKRTVDKATDKKAEDRPKDGLIHIIELEKTLKKVREERGMFKGKSTGYQSLDAKMGGLEPGSVVLIAGETSHGKSALATNIAANVSKTTPMLYVSLEMTIEQMIDRLDWVAGKELPTLELVFQESFAINYRDLEPLVKKAKEVHKVEVVVLDYLQYLGRGMQPDEVARMSKEVKSLALRYELCMVVITSVRKGSAEAKFRRKWIQIDVEDLMGTSAIAYDADTIVLVSRRDPENQPQNKKIFVKVLKTRNTRLDFKDNIVELEWDDTKITEKWLAPGKKPDQPKLPT